MFSLSNIFKKKTSWNLCFSCGKFWYCDDELKTFIVLVMHRSNIKVKNIQDIFCDVCIFWYFCPEYILERLHLRGKMLYKARFDLLDINKWWHDCPNHWANFNYRGIVSYTEGIQVLKGCNIKRVSFESLKQK